MADYLRKNEISKILGIPKSTVRYYEQAGLITPEIDDNQYRRYSIEELKLLSQINFMRDLDFDIESIKRILTEDSDDITDLLIQRKTDIKRIIKSLKSQLEHIDSILIVTQFNLEHLSYDIKQFEERHFYKLNRESEHLGDLLKSNTDFFNNHTLELGEWFVNTICIDSFLDNKDINFTEYIEISSENWHTIPISQSLAIPAGNYLCINLVFDHEEEPHWEAISLKIKSLISETNTKLRGNIALVINSDNLNFNFKSSKRILTIQFPIK